MISSVPDPFFEKAANTEWNACIGIQGNEDHYIFGYIEAAELLSERILGEKLWSKRDTLILPILYVTRHGLELALKKVCDSFFNLGILTERPKKVHDIKFYWELLDKLNFGDREFKTLLSGLKLYVDSLSNIDDDGQELRYFKNIDGNRSMEDKSIVNIALVYRSVGELKKIVSEIIYRTKNISRERQFESHTNACSRKDLIALANQLPNRDNWDSVAFSNAKKRIIRDYALSNRQFSKALDKIQSNRHMKTFIGLQTELNWITDEHLKLVLQRWATIHFEMNSTKNSVVNVKKYLEENFEEFSQYHNDKAIAVNYLSEHLPATSVIDLEKIYHDGREADLAEFYDYSTNKLSHEIEEVHDKIGTLHYLLSKTNLMNCVIKGLIRLGRPDLSSELAG